MHNQTRLITQQLWGRFLDFKILGAIAFRLTFYVIMPSWITEANSADCTPFQIHYYTLLVLD